MIFKVGERELHFDEEKKVISYEDKVFTPSVRTYGDMKSLYNGEDNSLEDDFWLYYMFRDIYFSAEDRNIFKENLLRYDITILVPKIIGKEQNKTYGHFHPVSKDGNTFQEVYEVLSWQAIYFEQSKEKSIFTPTFAWEKVVMKSWLWHVSINPSSDNYLVMANIIDDTFSANYGEYKDKKWWNYYYESGDWILNPAYQDIWISESKEKSSWTNIYDDFLSHREKYNFLHF